MRDYVYKMLKKSLKNEKITQDVLTRFDAYKILNINQDFDWSYEQSKCKFIWELVKARKEYSHKSILRAYKRQMRKTPYLWYDEFNKQAKSIIHNK